MTSVTKPKTFAAKITAPKNTADEPAHKIRKDTMAPDMGSYEPRKSQEYIEPKKGPSQKWETGPVVRYYEKMIKLNKEKPACNNYKVTSDHFNRLSKSPPSVRINRH